MLQLCCESLIVSLYFKITLIEQPRSPDLDVHNIIKINLNTYLKQMQRLIIILGYVICLTGWSLSSYGYSVPFRYNQHYFKPKADCELELDYTYYDLCYSLTHRQSLWAKHEVTPEQVKGKQKRTNNFKADDRLTDPVDPDDYRRSGFDRGHLVPAGDMKQNFTAMSESFFMTNMTPQNPSFNSGIWNTLEAHVRDEVLKLGAAIVITAPVLLKTQIYPRLKTNISIPDYFYKIIFFQEQLQMHAYLIPNAPSEGSKFTDYKVTVKEIEDLTGIDFFYELESNLQLKLETQI